MNIYIEMDINNMFKELLNGVNLKADISKNQFKLPIEYLEDKISISKTIKDDIELNYIQDETDNDISNISNCLYNNIFNFSSNREYNIIEQYNKYYTNNRYFLQDTQTLIKNIDIKETTSNIDKIDDTINDITNNQNFISKYQYIDLPYIHRFNNESSVLLLNSINNLINPIVVLIMPIIMLFIPFLLIKIQGRKVSLQEYLDILRIVLSKHVIGKLLFSFKDTTMSNRLYILISFGFYIFQIYLNINNCIKFHKYVYDINSILYKIKQYISESLNNFNKLLLETKQLTSYKNFNIDLENNIENLNNYYNNLSVIKQENFSYRIDLKNLGVILKQFYQLYNNKKIIDTMYYTINLNSYISSIYSIKKNIECGNINFCTYIDDANTTTIKEQYYAPLLSRDDKIIKNNLKLNNNIIISGPNASGKTTVLKSSIFNIILSQQIGCGFYKNAKIRIYDYLHCYINIPDTSNRDSLFQAEARRCKEILDKISNNPEKNHFCIFDELYSGTNPDEAVKSAYYLLDEISKYNKVDMILTTHYNKLCKKIKLNNENDKDKSNNKKIINYKMDSVIDENDNLVYNYTLVKGISKIKGGIKVLKQMEYPEDMIDKINID